MAWVKLDDQFFRNPKIVAAGRDARDLYMASLCYSASALTDGVIANSVLRILGAEADIDDAKGAAGRLVECGLWDLDEKGFRVHDYHDYQLSRDEVEQGKAIAQERKRAYQLRDHIIERDGMKCGICGKAIASVGDVDIDHILPLSKGGISLPDNLRVAHARCNRSRGNRA